jgi:poly(3-hydroxybutyrate) depolymerase
MNPPGASGGTAAGSGGTEPGTAGQSGSPVGGSLGTPAGGSGGTQSDGGAGQAGSPAAGSPGAPSGGSAGAGSPGDVVPSSGCDAADWPSSDTYDIDVSGSNREYILRIPDDYDPSRPYRLVVAFHWLNGTAQNVANGGGTTTGPFYGFWDLAEGSTIFVAPQGINNSWPSGNVPFAEALIDRLTSEFCIDESRIFASGFSMGGSMSYAVACGLGSRIRGVAVYSGGPMSGCDPHDEPVAYFMSHGTQDSVCTYPGFGVPQIEDFADVNGCSPREMPQPSGNEPSCVDYEGCSDGYPARACIFVGDHTPSPGGGGSWVPDEAWNFISQF